MSSLTKSVFWLTISEILFNLSGYIIHAVAGRVLGPSDYGRYALVVTLTTVIVILIGNGIPTAMSRYLSEVFETAPGKVLAIKRHGARLQVLLMGGVTLVFFLLSPVTAWLLGDPTLVPLLQLSSLIIPTFALASFYYYYFTGLHLFHYQAILKSFRSFVRIVVIVGMTVTLGLHGAVAGYAVVPLLVFALAWYFDRKTIRPFREAAQGAGADSTFHWRQLLSYAWPLTLFMLFYELFISIDLYLVKAVLGSDYLTGLYNAALTVGRIPYYLFYALAIVLLPALAKMNAVEDRAAMKRLMTQALRYAGIILFPLSLLLMAYARPTLGLLFGEDYLPGALALQMLVPGLSALTVFYLLANALNGVGRAALSLRLSLLGLIGAAGLNWWFLSELQDIFGAALATTLAALVTTGAALVIVHREIPFAVSWAGVAKTTLAGLVTALVLVCLPAHDWRFIPYALLTGGLYLGLLWWWKVLGPADAAPLMRRLKRGV